MPDVILAVGSFSPAGWRRCAGLFAFIFLAGLPARAETPAPLLAAVQKLQADENRWAYTQTTQAYDRTGRPDGGIMVEQCDPSQPDDRKWTLVLKDGKPPTARQVRTWKKRRDKEDRRRAEKPLGEVIDFEHARLVRETAAELVYELPIKPGVSRRFPEEKFTVFMTVDRAAETLEHVALRARESFRLAGVAKVDSLELEAKLQRIDPAHPPQPVHFTMRGAGRVLFVRVGGSAEVTLTDYRRVKPYNDRFQVELGELKVLDF